MSGEWGVSSYSRGGTHMYTQVAAMAAIPIHVTNSTDFKANLWFDQAPPDPTMMGPIRRGPKA